MSQEAAEKPLWALLPDLFLRVKIEAMTRREGRLITAFATPEALLERLDATAAGGTVPALVLVDLGAPQDAGFVLLEGLAARAGAPPTLAFFSHVDDAARRRAIELGATKVVPRSALVARFSALLDEVTAPASRRAAGSTDTSA